MNNSKQLLKALDYTDSIIVMTDTAGNILYVNKTFEKKYGYTKEEALGQNPRILKTNYHPAKFYKEMWDTIMAGNTWQGVFRNKAKDGTLLWENAIINPVTSASGDITGFIAVKEDVTDFRKTISELETSNKRYYSLVEDAPVIICRFNPHGLFTYVNNQFIDTFSVANENLNKRYFFEYLPEDKREEVKKNIFALTPDSPIYEFQCSLVLNNKNRWYKSICRAIFNSKNNIREYQVVSMEFTKLKETEDALNENQNTLKAIINNKLIGIIVFDRNNKFIMSNDYFVEMLGLNSFDELSSYSLFDFTHPDYKEVTRKNINALLNKELESFHITKKYIRKDGSEFWGDVFVSPIKSASGEVDQIAGMVINSTVRKKMELQMQENEKALKKLNKTKDKLFSIIAHDIKNPFNVIMGFANVLVSNIDDLTKNEIKDYAGKIVNASETVYKLLDDLLVWAKSQMGQLKVIPTRVNMNSIVTDIFNHFYIMTTNKELQMINNIPENTFVYADYEMIRFVLRNLVHNAIKFTPEGGEISIKCHSEGDLCTIEVTDSGIGIREEKLGKLFEMLDIMEDKNINNEKGTGLGLYLAKEMVLKNNGQIRVTSKEGQGTTFFITLPLYKE